MNTKNPEVLSALNELRELGASVITGECLEYRGFLDQFGQIEIVLERTWFFYGLEV